MINCVKKLESVSMYKIHNSGVLYSSLNDIHNLPNHSIDSILLKSNVENTFEMFQNNLYFIDRALEHKTIGMNLEDQGILFEDKYWLFFQGFNSLMAWGISSFNEGIDKSYFLFDITNKSLINKFPMQYGINGMWHVINDELFISKSWTILAVHELATGNEVWRFDVESLGTWEDFGDTRSHKIRTFRYHEPTQTILVAVSGHKLFALDALTGVVKWRFDFKMPTVEMTINGSELFVRNPLEYYYVFDISSGQVISEVDLRQSWLSQQEMFSGMLTNPVIYKDYLLMTDCYRMRVGIFDKYSCELIDSTVLEGASGMIPFSNVLQMQGNRLYQIDAEDNLHILEWEK